jgi:hypothetical protein
MLKKNEFIDIQHAFYHVPEQEAVMATSTHTIPASDRNFQAGFTIYDKISGHTTKLLSCNIRKFSSYNTSQLLKRICIAP